MADWGVIPSIRVRDMGVALAFYRNLGFTVARGDASADNCALDRGSAHIMLEVPTAFYSPAYNEAIRRRVSTPGAIALYIEAPDLEELSGKAEADGLTVIDPLADRPWGQAEFTLEDPDGNWLTFWKAPPASL